MISENTEQTENIARDFINNILNKEKPEHATVVAMIGDLGSGKTTFTQQIANILDIKETVTSPTFVIEKIYKLDNQIFKNLIHIDVYRLDEAKELQVLGFDEIIKDRNNIIFIEWADKIKEILPPNYIKISFTVIDQNKREINIEYV